MCKSTLHLMVMRNHGYGWIKISVDRATRVIESVFEIDLHLYTSTLLRKTINHRCGIVEISVDRKIGPIYTSEKGQKLC